MYSISALILGLIFGGLIFGGQSHQTLEEHKHGTEISGDIHTDSPATIWTCSMHPQIRQNEPGDCPICGMDLIPIDNVHESDLDPMAIGMSPTAMQLAGVTSASVATMAPERSVRLNGKVKVDERLVFSQSSHLPGRVEKLMVNFTGEFVTKGEIIASIYAPDLVTAQEELLEAQKIREDQPELFSAAKEKLKNWKLSDAQIVEILTSGEARESFNVEADVSGIVTQKKVKLGDYIKKGEAIYEIADLSRIWVLFDVYESDIPWIKMGDKVSFTAASLPGESFEGNISFIDPVIDPKTRVARARVDFNNPDLKLKPEMFTSGIVNANLSSKGNKIIVPKTAVMWTGKRSLVYVKNITDQGVNFRMREVTLGPSLGESFIIENGLEEGEEIAVNGTFSIDAAAQLAGKPSMMSPQRDQSITGHYLDGPEMKNKEEPSERETSIETKSINISRKFKEQLTDVYESYLIMKNAFVASDPALVGKKASEVLAEIKKTDMTLLEGEAHLTWMEQMKILKNQLAYMQQSEDIEAQRKAFALYNLTFYKTLKTFGLKEGAAHYQFCPMADNDKGAYWLSETEEIRNPYFGNAMLNCGENIEIIK